MLRQPALILTAALTASAVLSLAGCSTNAATGKSQFLLMSMDEEVAMGAQAAPEFTAEFGGGVTDPALQAYVKRIGADLAAHTETDNRGLPWEFTLLNSQEINAFALPGGKIFFTRGLAERLSSEAEMAGVLGHEVGHVTARHGNQSMSRAGLTSLLLQGSISLATNDPQTAQLYSQLGEQVGGVILLKYSRDQESEADSLGMRYMNACGYNPKSQRDVMTVLQQAMSGGRSAEILSSHPYPETRIQRIEALLSTTYAATQSAPNRASIDQQHKTRYATEFLPKLKALPAGAAPAPRTAPAANGVAPRRRAMLDAETGRMTFNLGDPTSWCAHCREEAEHAQQLAAK